MRQPSISQTLSDRIEVSDEQLDRLMSCMGYRLQVVRRSIEPEMTRSELRSWQLHRSLARQLNEATLQQWRPRVRKNLSRLRGSVQGEPHERNLRRWKSVINSGDVGDLHRIPTGLDRDSIEMCDVAPMSGLLTEPERLEALAR